LLSFLPPSFGHSYHTKGLFYVQTSYFFITGMLPVTSMRKKYRRSDLFGYVFGNHYLQLKHP
jgi:hypothetical protein